MAIWRKRTQGGDSPQHDDNELSESGAPILRHRPRTSAFKLADPHDDDLRTKVESHLTTFLGETTGVWHELLSDLVHIDVYHWAANPERPWHTFATVGMSDKPMNVPDMALAAGSARRAELLVCLPADWHVPATGATTDGWPEESYFPVRSLKMLARLPHEYDTWLGFGHTIPNGDPPRPFSSETALCGWVLLPPMTLPAAFRRLDLGGGEQLEFFSIIGLHAAEMDHKLRHGVESLFSGFDRDKVNEVLNLSRRSTI